MLERSVFWQLRFNIRYRRCLHHLIEVRMAAFNYNANGNQNATENNRRNNKNYLRSVPWPAKLAGLWLEPKKQKVNLSVYYWSSLSLVKLSRSSERILNLVFLWYKATNFRGIGGNCRLAAPTDFIRGISAGKLDSFRLEFVFVTDERGSVIRQYL